MIDGRICLCAGPSTFWRISPCCCHLPGRQVGILELPRLNSFVQGINYLDLHKR